MDLGGFSVSLAVKDLKSSKAFYENLGFHAFAGQEDKKYLIMKNGTTNIGLFEGMFEKNILTFNPGWDNNANETETFDDVRVLQNRLKKNGIEIMKEVDEHSSGPGSIMFLDPDGNPILVDQHR